MATSNSTTKVCSRCKREYPATTEYFRSAKPYKNGLYSQCRQCECERNKTPEARERIRQNYYTRTGGKPHEPKTKDGQRCCRTCKQWFPLDAEHFHRSNGKGNGGYAYNCIPCSLEKHKRYYAKNALRIKQSVSEYRKDNPDKIAPTQRVRGLRRRARLRSLPNTLTALEWEYALRYFDYRCAICGRKADMWTLIAADHWIPLSEKSPDNPGTVAGNIIPICHSKKGSGDIGCCNRSKSNKLPEEWLISRFGKRKAKQILKRIKTYFKSIQ